MRWLLRNYKKTLSMRKMIIMLVCALLSVNAFAQNPLMTVKSGSLDVFNESVNINVVIDDYDPIIDGRDKGAKEYYTEQGGSRYTDFCADLVRAHKSFVSYYNAEKSGVKSTVGTSDDAPYTLQIHVSLMNVGSGGASVFGLSHKSGGALINGDMKLVKNESGEVMCEIEFQGIKGVRCPTFNGRAISVYRYLADALLDIVQ